MRHLAEQGVRAGAGDHLVSEAFYLTDPDGLGIEVYADRPRNTWQRQGRELMMATDPVDVADLVRALFFGAGGYHHHLGTNTWAGPGARPPAADDARLLEWTIELPDAASVAAAGRSLADAGYAAEDTTGRELVTRDPWGTAIRLRAAAAPLASG